MSAGRDELMSKIKKCLALTVSSNEHEAATALRKAQELMEENSITEAEMLAAEATEIAHKASATEKPSGWESLLVRRIGGAFGCRIIFCSGSGEWVFIGCGSAPDVARYAFEVLLRQAKRARGNYIKTSLKRCKQVTKTARADAFCIGWVTSASSQLEIFHGTQNNEKALEAYIAANHPSLSTVTPKDRTRLSAVRNSDYVSGQISGRSAELNRGVSGDVINQDALGYGGAA